MIAQQAARRLAVLRCVAYKREKAAIGLLLVMSRAAAGGSGERLWMGKSLPAVSGPRHHGPASGDPTSTNA